jgi:hypothetical protein
LTFFFGQVDQECPDDSFAKDGRILLMGKAQKSEAYDAQGGY